MSTGTVLNLTRTRPSGCRVTWSVRIRLMRTSGWANSSVNRPATHV